MVSKVLATVILLAVMPFSGISQSKMSLSVHGLYQVPENSLDGFPDIRFSTHLNSNLPVLLLAGNYYLPSFPDRSGDPEYLSEQLNLYSRTLPVLIKKGSGTFRTYTIDTTHYTGIPVTAPDTLTVTSRIERDLDFYQGDASYTNWTEATPGEGWIWAYLNKGGTLNITLPQWVNGFTGPMQAKVRLRGVSRDTAADPDHVIQVSWKGTVIEKSFTGYNYLAPDFSFPGGSSTSRVLAIKSVGVTKTTVDRIYVDWVEISGKRSAAVDTTMMGISIPATRQNSEFLVLKVPVARNYMLIDSLGSKVRFPQELSVSGAEKLIAFSLTGLSSGSLFLTDLASVLSLPQITPVTASGSLPGSENFLIISHPDFLSFAEDYASYRSETPGIVPRVVTTEEIYSGFSAMNPTPWAIRAFLQAETKRNPALKSVLLVGNANWDHREITNKSGKKAFIPGFGMPVSDQWLVAFADTNKVFSFLDIGRLPINTVQEGTQFLEKVKRWENQKSTDPNVKRFTFINGGFDASEQKTFYNQTMRIINDYVYDPSVMGKIDTIIKRTEGYQDAGKETPKIQKSFKEGMVWLSFIGHAGSRTWDLMLSDVRELPVGDGLYPFITSMTCFTGDYGNPSQESFSEDFVLKSDRGAIGFIGTSGLGYVDLDELLSRGFYNAALKGRNKSMGRLITAAKNELAKKYKQNDRVRSILRQYNLIGDPTLELPLKNFPDLSVTSQTRLLKNTDTTYTLNLSVLNNGKVLADTAVIRVRDLTSSGNQEVLVQGYPVSGSFLTTSVPLKFTTPGTHSVETEVQFKSVTDSFQVNNEKAFEILIPRNTLTLFNLADNQILPSGNFLLRLYYPGETNLSWAVKNPDGQILLSGVKSVKNLDSLQINLISLSAGFEYTLELKPEQEDQPSSVSFFTAAGQKERTVKIPYGLALSPLTRLSHGQIGILTGAELIGAGSAGFESGNFGFITSGSKTVFCGFRGIIAARIDSLTLEIKESGEFDTYLNTANADSLNSWIKRRLNSNDYLIFAIKDEGSRNLTADLKSTFRSLGSIYADSVKIREAWVFGVKAGKTPVKIFESYSRSRLVKAYAEFEAPYQPGLITVSIPGNPGKKLEKLSFTILSADSSWIRSTSAGLPEPASAGHYELTVPETDTLSLVFKNSVFTQQPVLEFDSSEYDEDYPSGVFGLEKSVPKLSVGEPFSISTSLFQPYFSDSEVTRLQFTITRNSTVFMTKDSTFTKNRFQIPVQFQVPQNTITDTGLYNFTIKITEGDHFPDFVSVSDTFSVVLSTGVNAFDPAATVFFKERELNPAEKELVTQKGPVRIRIDYDDFIPLDDTTKVLVTLNGDVVPAGKSLTVKSENNRQYTELSFDAELVPGINQLDLSVKMPFGEYSGEGKQFSYVLSVNAEDGISSMANYPNPFEEETRVFFILGGLDNPVETTLMIYTVNGLKIRTIKSATSEIGYNTLLWDGLDEDRDVVANGIYLYKLLVNFGDKTVSQTGKMLKVR